MYDSFQHFVQFTSLCHRGAVLEIRCDPNIKKDWFGNKNSDYVKVVESKLEHKHRVSKEFIESKYPTLQSIYDEALENIALFRDKLPEVCQEVYRACLLVHEILTNEPLKIQRNHKNKLRITYEDFMVEVIKNDKYYFVRERDM